MGLVDPPLLAVDVVGRPTPKGSKRALVHRYTGKAVVVESGGEHLRNWRAAISITAARAWAARPPFPAAVALAITYYLRRPKARKYRDATWVTTTPDLDKADRAVLDSLVSAGVLQDDRLVVLCVSRKLYATSWTGARIVLRAVVGPPIDSQDGGPHDAATSDADLFCPDRGLPIVGDQALGRR